MTIVLVAVLENTVLSLHIGNETLANRDWQGPENVNKRENKKNPARK